MEDWYFQQQLGVLADVDSLGSRELKLLKVRHPVLPYLNQLTLFPQDNGIVWKKQHRCTSPARRE